MNYLGIIGSARKLGNTEILVKEALKKAHERGDKVTLIRLTDMALHPCEGCMACIFKGAPCHINDDMAFLLESLLDAGAVILGAPTYVLAPAGVLKLMTDRLFMMSTRVRSSLAGKRAATVAVAGVRDWEPFSLPLLNMVPLALGMELLDSFAAYAPGPGEVLLHRAVMERAALMGELLDGKALSPPPREAMHCPLCKGTFFLIRSRDVAECPLCALQGTYDEKDGRMHFNPSMDSPSRWSPLSMERHIEGWIKGTERGFRSRSRDILGARKAYRQMDHCFARPS
ncbi:MAG: flavodoxin family protein [Candidatus Eremiobacteraeota bacterium]|nr:flavodoxin family protein [Candidatus Eremiobacteraeota bacterium]